MPFHADWSKGGQQISVRKAPVNNKAFVDTVQLNDTTVTQKNEVVKETRTSLATGTDTQILPEANIRAQLAAQVAAKGEFHSMRFFPTIAPL